MSSSWLHFTRFVASACLFGVLFWLTCRQELSLCVYSGDIVVEEEPISTIGAWVVSALVGFVLATLGGVVAGLAAWIHWSLRPDDA